MTIATIALYVVVIMGVLTLSTRMLWALFIVFTYRTLSLLIPYDWVFGHIAPISHNVYFIVLLLVSVGGYLALMRFTYDFKWIQIVVLLLLGFITLKNFDILDVFLLRDYLESIGLWGFDTLVEEIKEIFTLGPKGFAELMGNIMQNITDVIFGLFEA